MQVVSSLFVSADKFTEMVNLPVDEYVKNIKGADYLNHAHACWLMKLHFPSYAIEFLLNERGLPFFEVEPDPLDASEAGVERGVFLACYVIDLSTGQRSQTMWYPVMGNAKGAFKPSAINATSRQMHDQMMRAKARLIAEVTGIGYNLWLRLEEELLDEEAGILRDKAKANKREVYEEDEDEDVFEDDDFEDDEDEEEEYVKPAAKRKTTSKLPRKPLSQRRR